MKTVEVLYEATGWQDVWDYQKNCQADFEQETNNLR
jgi:hypothetical protein